MMHSRIQNHCTDIAQTGLQSLHDVRISNLPNEICILRCASEFCVRQSHWEGRSER